MWQAWNLSTLYDAKQTSKLHFYPNGVKQALTVQLQLRFELGCLDCKASTMSTNPFPLDGILYNFGKSGYKKIPEDTTFNQYSWT